MLGPDPGTPTLLGGPRAPLGSRSNRRAVQSLPTSWPAQGLQEGRVHVSRLLPHARGRKWRSKHRRRDEDEWTDDGQTGGLSDDAGEHRQVLPDRQTGPDRRLATEDRWTGPKVAKKRPSGWAGSVRSRAVRPPWPDARRGLRRAQSPLGHASPPLISSLAKSRKSCQPFAGPVPGLPPPEAGRARRGCWREGRPRGSPQVSLTRSSRSFPSTSLVKCHQRSRCS